MYLYFCTSFVNKITERDPKNCLNYNLYNVIINKTKERA